MKLLNSLLILLFLVKPVYAITTEEFIHDSSRDLTDYITEFVDIPKGGLDWKLFGKTKEINIETTTEDGYDSTYTKPEFQPELKALDGKEVKIKGYMFPLGEEEKQKLFLFGPFPLSCPFRYHVGPPLVIEVHANKNPIKFDYEPITIIGKLELVDEDPEYSIFYRLKNTRLSK